MPFFLPITLLRYLRRNVVDEQRVSVVSKNAENRKLLVFEPSPPTEPDRLQSAIDQLGDPALKAILQDGRVREGESGFASMTDDRSPEPPACGCIA